MGSAVEVTVILIIPTLIPVTYPLELTVAIVPALLLSHCLLVASDSDTVAITVDESLNTILTARLSTLTLLTGIGDAFSPESNRLQLTMVNASNINIISLIIRILFCME